MTGVRDNVDPAELAKFNSLAARWWDMEGDFRPLHQINPLRLDWIRTHVRLDGSNALDIGCGGGILAESMAAAGATVTGIDMFVRQAAKQFRLFTGITPNVGTIRYEVKRAISAARY